MQPKSKHSKKLIYVGSLNKTPDRDSMWIRELSNLGWKVLTFSSRVNISGNYILKKIKKRFSFGAEYREMRFKLIELCEYEKPSFEDHINLCSVFKVPNRIQFLR